MHYKLQKLNASPVFQFLLDYLTFYLVGHIDFPAYRFPGLDNWLNEVKSFIEDKKQSDLTNWYGYEIWNEPDDTWKDPNGLNFNDLWKKTYDAIKQNDPIEKIIGPCYSWYQEDKFKSFLSFTEANN